MNNLLDSGLCYLEGGTMVDDIKMTLEVMKTRHK